MAQSGVRSGRHVLQGPLGLTLTPAGSIRASRLPSSAMPIFMLRG
jgi:hypothetical protein